MASPRRSMDTGRKLRPEPYPKAIKLAFCLLASSLRTGQPKKRARCPPSPPRASPWQVEYMWVVQVGAAWLTFWAPSATGDLGFRVFGAKSVDLGEPPPFFPLQEPRPRSAPQLVFEGPEVAESQARKPKKKTIGARKTEAHKMPKMMYFWVGQT